jgi:hypothetical protein
VHVSLRSRHCLHKVADSVETRQRTLRRRHASQARDTWDLPVALGIQPVCDACSYSEEEGREEKPRVTAPRARTLRASRVIVFPHVIPPDRYLLDRPEAIYGEQKSATISQIPQTIIA